MLTSDTLNSILGRSPAPIGGNKNSPVGQMSQDEIDQHLNTVNPATPTQPQDQGLHINPVLDSMSQFGQGVEKKVPDIIAGALQGTIGMQGVGINGLPNPISSLEDKALTQVRQPLQEQGTAQKFGGIATNALLLLSPLMDEGVPEEVSSAFNTLKGFFSGGSEAESVDSTANAAKELESIKTMISPAQTDAETQAAASQGRLVQGKPATFFKDGTPDEILPSDKITQTTFKIQQQIPAEDRATQADLANALKSKVSDIAQELKPQLEKVDLQPETTNKMSNDWQTLKATQQQNPDFMNNSGVNKQVQVNFERTLTNLQKDGTNLNDVWNAQQSFDDSIPKNVKSAGPNGDPNLYFRKEMWLQDRNILGSTMKDSSTGLGATAQKSFSDMSDFINARQTALSNIEANTEAAPSTIKKLGTKAAVMGVKAAGLGKVIDVLK